MRLLRRLFQSLLISTLRLTLIFGVTAVCLLWVIGNPNRIKHTIVSNSAYTQFVPSVLASQTKENGSSLPLDNPDVRKIITDQFSPQLMQQTTESVIDNAYLWLDGITPSFAFKINFTSQRDAVAVNLADYAFNRLAALPVCDTVPATIDAFTATCRPQYFDFSSEQAVFKTQVANLLPKTVFTAQDLPKMSNGNTFAENFKRIPVIFHVFKLSPYIVLGLLILLTVGILQFSRSLRNGWRTIGSVLLSSGIALVITPILYEIVYPRISSSLALQSSDSGTAPVINNVFNDLGHTFYTYLIVSSIVMINAGIGILIFERITRPSSYRDLASRTGVSTSDKPRKTTTKRGTPANAIPIQSSEDSKTSKSGRRYRSYRTLHDKE